MNAFLMMDRNPNINNKSSETYQAVAIADHSNTDKLQRTDSDKQRSKAKDSSPSSFVSTSLPAITIKNFDGTKKSNSKMEQHQKGDALLFTSEEKVANLANLDCETDGRHAVVHKTLERAMELNYLLSSTSVSSLEVSVSGDPEGDVSDFDKDEDEIPSLTAYFEDSMPSLAPFGNVLEDSSVGENESDAEPDRSNSKARAQPSPRKTPNTLSDGQMLLGMGPSKKESRWGNGNQDFLPSSPRRRSLEYPRSDRLPMAPRRKSYETTPAEFRSTGILPNLMAECQAKVRRASCDTLPSIPSREYLVLDEYDGSESD